MWGNPGRSRTGEDDGPYRLVRQLSEDPFGALWVGEGGKSGESVTLRELRVDLMADDRFERWLRLELRPLSLLCHPNILKVNSSDVGPEGRIRSVIMAGFEGESLAQRLDRDKTLDRGEAAAVAQQVGEALDAAHEIGLVHGGISADNVLLTREGTVKVIDFGIPTALWLAARHPPRGATPNDPLPEIIGPEPDRDGDARALELLVQHMLFGVRPAEEQLETLVKVVLEGLPGKPSSLPLLAGAPFPTRRLPAVAAAVALVATVAIGLVAVRSGSVSPQANDPHVGSPSEATTASPSATAAVRVPDVEGLTAMEAQELLMRTGLVIADAVPAAGPLGEVVGTEPATSQLVAPGTAVTLLVGAPQDRLDES
jgi:serine/threonine protein kinase